MTSVPKLFCSSEILSTPVPPTIPLEFEFIIQGTVYPKTPLGSCDRFLSFSNGSNSRTPVFCRSCSIVGAVIIELVETPIAWGCFRACRVESVGPKKAMQPILLPTIAPKPQSRTLPRRGKAPRRESICRDILLFYPTWSISQPLHKNAVFRRLCK